MSPILKHGKRSGKPSPQSLEALVKVHENVLRADMKGALKGFQKSADYDSIKDAVYSKKWQKVYGAIPTEDIQGVATQGLKRLGKVVSEGSFEGAKALADSVGITRVGRQLDPDELKLGLNNPAIKEYTDVRTGALIENVTDNLQVNVQTALQWGMRTGASPQDIANRIVDGLPLNDRQEKALANYKQGLKETGWSDKRQQSMADQYAERLQSQRAIMIARTESQYAANQGQLIVWRNAQEGGLLPDVCYKVWILGNGDACKYCKDLAGSEVQLDEVFTSSLGDEVDGPPLHPNCFCSMTLNTTQDVQE